MSTAPPCLTCGASIDEASARFCPICGARLDAPTTLDDGRYRLTKRLGAGGMGQVFLAEDTRLKVRRAIKVLSVPGDLPDADRAALKARMIQEARAAQTLADFTHHVVRVFDVGFAAERGEPYLVMELLEGETLGARIARAPLPFDESLRIAQTLAGALAQAHRRGFVHRDLKPDNIMLCRRDDADDFVKVLDFGLVKAEQAEVKTESGHMMGTLQYMPPEQLRGAPIDARADVFSLAAVLYECFSGQRANPGKTQHQIFGVLLDRGIPSLREAAPHLPPLLIALIDRCLQLEKTARPPDAGALLVELERITTAQGPIPIGFEATALPQPTPLPTPAPQRPSTGASLANGEVQALGSAPQSSARWLVVALIGLGLAALIGWLLTADDDDPRAIAQPVTEAPALPVSAPISAAVAVASTVTSAAPPSRPVSLGAPEGPLVDHPKVERQALPDGRTRYRGAAAQQRAAIVMDQTLAQPALWPNLADATRRQLARRIDWRRVLVDDAGALIDAPLSQRLAEVARRPAATLLDDGAAAPIVTGKACGDLAEGDRVFTLRWSILGYGGGRCSAQACVDELARALRSSRQKGERLDLRFTVLRGEDDRQQTIRCSVRG
ncbi:MAG: serine/threonine protein kinase [Bradymonadia bacterium]